MDLQEYQVYLGHKVIQGCPVLQVHQDQVTYLDQQALLDKQALLVLQAFLAVQGQQVIPVLLVIQDCLALLAL